MKDKVVVVTGGTSGIGQVAAEKLAAMGARIVMVARDKVRGEAVITRLRQLRPGVNHTLHIADLSSMEGVRRVGREIASAEPRIDVLINNAGAMFYDRQVTVDGLERTFATNHMAYFILTLALRPSLIAAAPSRVINTASDAHRSAKLDFEDLQCEKKYRAFTAYGRSKLSNILFTRELARKLAGTGVTANSLHPGVVNTRFANDGHGALYHVFRVVKTFALSPEKGAETTIYLASSPDVAGVTGEYFRKCARATPTKEAQDDDAAGRLWAESLRLAGMN